MGKQPKSASGKTGPLVGNWIHIVRVLLFSAAIITAYLSLAALSQAETIPGCGPDSGCDTRFSSSVHSELREATARKPSVR